MKLPFAQIEPTTRCNYTCGFCAGRHMPQQDMSLETFRSFIDQAEGLEHIELQGEGEPLLHPQFFEMIGLARRKFPGLQVSLITNGSLFTAENIDRLLQHRVARIFVSMESADDASFRRIRGGSLERVRRGIRSLLDERDARGQEVPVVGLAVTILKTTVQEASQGISDFYRDLRLDGGITAQRLQAMPQYSRLYPEATRGEMPDEADIGRLNDDIRRNPAFVAALRQRQDAPGFYERLYASVDLRLRCPWLENALYVSTRGDLVPCCHAKDYARDRLGELGTGVEGALRKRAAMQRQLQQGQIPSACTGCPIAHGVALHALSAKKGS
jgi:MoaA/NifB/PqqE/SkfB family radical SAM enzyme